MKKNVILISVILATVLLSVLTVLTVVRLKNLGTQPVAPSAPKSRPGAVDPYPWGRTTCKFTFNVVAAPSSTPTPTGTIRPTATPTPCRPKIQGRVYLDVSQEADFRVSDQEVFGPVGFRVDLKTPGASAFETGAGQKGQNSDGCSSTGGYSTLNQEKKSGYALRLVLNDKTWEVSEAYLANGSSCKSNKAGSVATIGLGSAVATIQGIDLDSCGVKNIWFGVRKKGVATPTPTGTIRPTATPTVVRCNRSCAAAGALCASGLSCLNGVCRNPSCPARTDCICPGVPTATPTGSPVPTATNTPGPTATNTPTPTNTPVPGGSFCEYLTADPTSGSTPLTVHFSGKGFDSTRIKGFRFNFGDGEKQEFFGSFNADHIQRVDHTYNKSGIYNATLEILDNGDHWRTRDECRVTITVSTLAGGPTPTPRPTSEPGATATPKPTKVPSEVTPTEAELPEAGLKLPTIWGIIGGFLLISLGAALVF